MLRTGESIWAASGSAERRGRNPMLWLLIAVVLTPAAGLALLVLKPQPPDSAA
jgi:hypothetical protein